MSMNDWKNVTVQIPTDLLAKLDAEAERLDLNRSQYFRRLIRAKLAETDAKITPTATQAQEAA